MTRWAVWMGDTERWSHAREVPEVTVTAWCRADEREHDRRDDPCVDPDPWDMCDRDRRIYD